MSELSKQSNFVSAIDIGSTKVVFAIAQAKQEGIEVVGLGRCDHNGVKHGLVVNLDSTSKAIQKAKEEAELMAGTSVSEAWLGVGGTYIDSFLSSGMVAISSEHIEAGDIERVIDAAKAVAISSDREVLHVIPNAYKVDNQDGIVDPLGMSGVRLEASVLIVTAVKSALQNSIRAVESLGVKVLGPILQPLAAAKAVLTEDEIKMGVVLAMIGGGKTELMSFVGGSAHHTAVIPVGGTHFTNDIALGLRTTHSNAETLKLKHASAVSFSVNNQETIEVESIGGRSSRTIDKKTLCEIVEARAEETLDLIARNLKVNNLEPILGSGIVMSGGGSLLNGFLELSDYTFDIPVRLGAAQPVAGLSDVVKSPEYSTVVGLLKLGMERSSFGHQVETKGDPRLSYTTNESSKDGTSVTDKIKKYFESLF